MHVIGTSRRPDLPLAVVVGAGGLGVAIARRLALGHRILLADVDEAKATAEATRLCAEGCDATSTGCDITSRSSVAKLAQVVSDKGGYHAVVQVAGLSPRREDFMTSFGSILPARHMSRRLCCRSRGRAASRS